MEASLARSTATITATPSATAATVSSARTGSVIRGRTMRRYSTTAHAAAASMEVSRGIARAGGA